MVGGHPSPPSRAMCSYGLSLFKHLPEPGALDLCCHRDSLFTQDRKHCVTSTPWRGLPGAGRWCPKGAWWRCLMRVVFDQGGAAQRPWGPLTWMGRRRSHLPGEWGGFRGPRAACCLPSHHLSNVPPRGKWPDGLAGSGGRGLGGQAAAGPAASAFSPCTSC